MCIPQHLIVGTEADLILLRQMVRQSARMLALTPAQQARITAAVSEVVRALLHHFTTSAVVIHCDDQGASHALVIECETEGEAYHRITRQESVKTALSLMDETHVASSAAGVHLTMKVCAPTSHLVK